MWPNGEAGLAHIRTEESAAHGIILYCTGGTCPSLKGAERSAIEATLKDTIVHFETVNTLKDSTHHRESIMSLLSSRHP